MTSRRAFAAASVLSLAAILLFSASRSIAYVPAPDTLPTALSDTEFWHLVTDFSEQAGNFRFQFMSNEREFPEVAPELSRTIKGGVYLGVGPEQNFTYIAVTQPKMAFIFDIRRQNMIEHLIYKALFEMSADRNQFVARLFSRRPLAGWSSQGSVHALFEGYAGTAPDHALFNQNLKAIKDKLTQEHHFQLSSADLADIDDIYGMFVDAGPGGLSRYGGFGGYGFGGNNYVALMTSTDDQGRMWSYLASDENFKVVRELHRKNLIIPLVGNFAGDKAIRAVAKYLKERQAVVSVFYCSNVEQYLFQQGDDWHRFYANVATLPVDSVSTFIRSSHFAFGPAQQRRQQFGGTSYYMLLASIAELDKSFAAGRIRSYEDVIRLSR